MTDDAQSQPITELLQLAHEGDERALDRAVEVVHRDLIRIAQNLMFRKYGEAMYGKTLEPSAVVNEAFLILRNQRNPYQNRKQFFAIAMKVMDRVLKDYDKQRGRAKRGGDQIRVSLADLGQAAAVPPETDLPTLGRAFERLVEEDERAAKVAKLRLLWGLEIGEIAEVLEVSRATVDRDWRFGRRWLREELGGQV